MSRRDQLFQTVNNLQGHVYGFLDARTGPAPSQPSSSSGRPPAPLNQQAHSSHASNGSGVQRSNTTVTLPLYSRNPNDPSEAAPQAVLQAPPGQAQAAADMMPRARMAQGTGREARRAAADLREEQVRSGELKTRHTFVSSGGRVVMDIDTAVPQRTLTYMGGTAERGRGAIKGRIAVHAQANERVSAIRLKIKGVVRVMVPKASTPQQPYALERGHPSVEPCVEKEILVLQLESQLYDAAIATAHGSNTSSDPTLMSPGKHEFPFSIDVPSQTGKGVELPPSFVLAPLNKPEEVQRPQATSKLDAIISSIPTPHMSSDWASVKWYIKLTIERPGIFRANERIFAPFVYLPPPPSGLRGLPEQVLRRLRLASEVESLLRRFHAASGARPIDLQRLCEPLSQWETIRLAYGANRKTHKTPVSAATDTAPSKKPGLLSKMLFGAQVEQKQQSLPAGVNESFAVHIPKKPFVFALRSGIPYVLSRSVEWTGRGTVSSETLTRLPNVGLYQRTNVYARGNKGPIAGTTSRFVAAGRQPPDVQPVWTSDERAGSNGAKGQVNRRSEYWLGVIDLPPSCAPCFETSLLTLEYYLGVRSPHAPHLLYTEPIVLVCPPSTPARVMAASQPPTASLQQLSLQPPSRTGTPSSMDARRRKGTTDANGGTPASPGRVPSTSAAAIPPATSLAGKHAPLPVTPAPRLELNPAPSSASRPIPPTPVSRPAASPGPSSSSNVVLAAEEKRVMQARYDEQIRASQQQHSASTSSAPGASFSSSASAAAPLQHGHSSTAAQPVSQTSTAPPAPPPRSSVVDGSGSSAASTVHAAGTATPLTMDNDGESGPDEPDRWHFHDDELTDLPPSYFEATGQRDQD